MKSALVTGVSRRAGIGFAIARRLEDERPTGFKHGWSAHDAQHAPDDASRLIARLCSDDARRVTGQATDSEGGFRRQAPPR
jgi:NAD(P)-dependent dehydrogenase (short-subunit alcohol dehydrogenase family)